MISTDCTGGQIFWKIFKLFLVKVLNWSIISFFAWKWSVFLLANCYFWSLGSSTSGSQPMSWHSYIFLLSHGDHVFCELFLVDLNIVGSKSLFFPLHIFEFFFGISVYLCELLEPVHDFLPDKLYLLIQ